MFEAMDNDDRSIPIDKQTTPKAFALSGKIMLTAIIVLFFVVALMLALHLYARWYLLRARRRQLLRRRSRYMNHNRRPNIVFYVDNDLVSDPANQGLEPEVLNSLPLFVYSSKNHPEELDCAVCLSEFEENDKGRLLPKCNHSFHIECIDMWFHSHSTCPLCRTPVEAVHQPENNRSDVVVVSLGEPEGRGIEPGSSSGLCAACHHEYGDSSTTSLAARRKGLDFTGVRIEVPRMNELETEWGLSSPASPGYRSPGTRLLSLRRILSMGRKTPTGASTTPSGVGPSCGGLALSEIDLERGATELTQVRTPR